MRSGKVKRVVAARGRTWQNVTGNSTARRIQKKRVANRKQWKRGSAVCERKWQGK